MIFLGVVERGRYRNSPCYKKTKVPIVVSARLKLLLQFSRGRGEPLGELPGTRRETRKSHPLSLRKSGSRLA